MKKYGHKKGRPCRRPDIEFEVKGFVLYLPLSSMYNGQ